MLLKKARKAFHVSTWGADGYAKDTLAPPGASQDCQRQRSFRAPQFGARKDSLFNQQHFAGETHIAGCELVQVDS